jgi:riboflavin kinase/FMN adenylyltransferase
MLGRPFEVRGEIFAGKGEGSRLGYPTVNLKPSSLNIRLPLGVYAAEVGGVRAVANYGLAPTFGERAWGEPVVEVHFLRQVPKMQGGFAEVKLLRFLRAEQKFDSPDALKAQIARDCAAALA